MANQFAGRYYDVFLDVDSTLITLTPFAVYEDAAATIPATTYTDRTKAAQAPLVLSTDDLGMAEFFAEPGVYWIKVGRIPATRKEVVPEDPEDTVDQGQLEEAIADFETVVGAQAKADAAQNSAQAYVDVQLGLRSQKEPVRAVATTNVNVTNPGTAVFDTVTFDASDPIERRRLLLTGQTASTENGIYVFGGASVALVRAADADISAEMKSGFLVVVQEGSSPNRDKVWELQTDAPITLGDTPLTFGLASGDTTGLALDANVVHKAGTETISGDKDFTGSLTSNGTSVAIALTEAPSVFTASFTALANTIHRIDSSTGAIGVILPTAPPDKTRIVLKDVIQGGTNAVTYTCGGSDVINRTGGSTSGTLSILGQTVNLQYRTSGGIWTVTAGELPLPQLDLRFAPIIPPLGSANNPVTNAAATRPTGLPIVYWTCTTQPTNWASGDVWTNNS